MPNSGSAAFLAQQVFDSDINSFCRRFLVTAPGVAEPSAAAYMVEMTKLRKALFENLLLFDKLALKITGEAIPIPLLIGALGRKGFDSLIEQEAIEFVLWNEKVGWLVNNVPGVDGMVSMAHNTSEYVDPQMSIDSGLKWMTDAPQGRARQQLVRQLVPLFRRIPANAAANSLAVVRGAVRNGGLEAYGVPKIPGEHADNLTAAQKKIIGKCADDLAEYEFILKNDMTSFSNYRYFSPFWASAERFNVMNRTVSGFSSVAKLEGLPDLKGIFDGIKEPLKRLPEIRQTANARFFRDWLEKTAGDSPDTDMVKAYVEAISERKGIFDSGPRKLLKTVGFAAFGVIAGTVVGEEAGLAIGTAAGTFAGMAAIKLAELTAETGIGLFDAFILDRVAKGRSPRMFLDDLSKLREH
jgi:hypothetical protein